MADRSFVAFGGVPDSRLDRRAALRVQHAVPVPTEPAYLSVPHLMVSAAEERVELEIASPALTQYRHGAEGEIPPKSPGSPARSSTSGHHTGDQHFRRGPSPPGASASTSGRSTCTSTWPAHTLRSSLYACCFPSFDNSANQMTFSLATSRQPLTPAQGGRGAALCWRRERRTSMYGCSTL